MYAFPGSLLEISVFWPHDVVRVTRGIVIVGFSVLSIYSVATLLPTVSARRSFPTHSAVYILHDVHENLVSQRGLAKGDAPAELSCVHAAWPSLLPHPQLH
jgi:hypothetical protein